MTEPIGWSLNGIDYCPEHTPTSRLAELQKQPIGSQPLTGPKRKCYVCGGQL